MKTTRHKRGLDFKEKRIKDYRIYAREKTGKCFYDSTLSGVDMQEAIDKWKKDSYTKNFRIINIEEYKWKKLYCF